jgi:putative transposase
MTTDSMTTVDDATLFLGEAWSDPIEAGIRDRIQGFVEELMRRNWPPRWDEDGTNAGIGAATAKQARPTTRRPPRRPMSRRSPVTGTVFASVTGSFGTVEIAVPRARVGQQVDVHIDGGTPAVPVAGRGRPRPRKPPPVTAPVRPDAARSSNNT